jgi:hypothetical protein
MQDIANDSYITSARQWLEVPLEVISFEYDTYTRLESIQFASKSKRLLRWGRERASLSWHLTAGEKKNIIDNLEKPHNKRALERLDSVLKQ